MNFCLFKEMPIYGVQREIEDYAQWSGFETVHTYGVGKMYIISPRKTIITRAIVKIKIL